MGRRRILINAHPPEIVTKIIAIMLCNSCVSAVLHNIIIHCILYNNKNISQVFDVEILLLILDCL